MRIGTPPPALCPTAIVIGGDDTETPQPIHPGDGFYLEASAQFAGYVAAGGRTVECTSSGKPVVMFPDAPSARAELHRALVPGASSASIRAAGTGCGELFVTSVGLGFEDVLVDEVTPDDGLVLADQLTALYVRADSNEGRIRWSDTVLVTPDGAEALTTLGVPND